MNNKIKPINRIAFLVSCAAVLQIAESLIPHPIPGIRLGMANMVTLIALVHLGFYAAIEITLFRTVISSFIMGSFLSPGFFLSFSGGIASTLVMGIIYKLSTSQEKFRISIVGISLFGALTHNMVQINLAYLLLIHHKSIYVLLPWLGISSVIMGWITGLIALKVCMRLKRPLRDPKALFVKTNPGSSFRHAHYLHHETLFHKIRPEIKIVFVVLLAVIVLIFDHLILYSILQILLLIFLFISKVRFSIFLQKLKKLSVIILMSFFMPLLLSHNGRILFHVGFLNITRAGFILGTTFAFRIVLLLTSASLLMWTTIPEALTSGLSQIFLPLRMFGFSSKRFAAILTASWTMLPELWDKIRSYIREKTAGVKKVRAIIPAISDVIASLYLNMNEEENI